MSRSTDSRFSGKTMVEEKVTSGGGKKYYVHKVLISGDTRVEVEAFNKRTAVQRAKEIELLFEASEVVETNYYDSDGEPIKKPREL